MLTSEGFQTSKRPPSPPAAKRPKLKQHVEYYFASDASAMVEHTKRVLHLEDDDVAHLHDGGYGIYRMERILSNGIESPVNYEPTVQSAEVERTVETLKMEVEQIMKGNFKHFMQKEIHEQPEAMMQGMRGRMVVSDDGKTAGTRLPRRHGQLRQHHSPIPPHHPLRVRHVVQLRHRRQAADGGAHGASRDPRARV